jgi:type II secretory pathway pseudopilin PulG
MPSAVETASLLAPIDRKNCARLACECVPRPKTFRDSHDPFDPGAGQAIALAGVMSFRLTRDGRGFSLVETLVAAGILVTTLASLAQLVAWSVTQTREAGGRSRAMSAAQDKLEKLRALPFTLDLDGTPVTDSALATSPSGALDVNTSGNFEYIDGTGRIVLGSDALVVRRWGVEPIDSGTPDAIAITVCVFRLAATNTGRKGADVCVSTARVRQP